MIPDTRIPDPLNRGAASAFRRGPTARRLRLVIDWETIPRDVAYEVLEELSRHPLIEAIGTRRTSEEWVEIAPADPQLPDGAVVRRGDQVVSTHAIGYGADSRLPSAPQPGSEEAWRVAAGLAQFTTHASYDALVSLRPEYSGRFAAHIGAREMVLPPRDAIALAGLFVRSRGEFNRAPRIPGLVHWRAAEFFYQDLAAILVPSLVVWSGAALPTRSRDLYDENCALAMSLVRQLSRVLRARDGLQVLRRGDVTLDDACEIAAHFELALLSLSGVFDGLAKLADAIYSLKKETQEGWTKPRFLKKLNANPDTRGLAQVASENPVLLTQQMLAEMRNTVHGPTLLPRVFTGSRRRRAIVGMPPNRVDRFQEIVASWEGLPRNEKWWGVEYHRRGPDNPERPNMYTSTPNDPVAEIWIDPGVCLERLLVLSFAAIHRIASHIDWSRLPRLGGTGQLAGLGFLPLGFLPPGDDRLQERLFLLGGVWL